MGEKKTHTIESSSVKGTAGMEIESLKSTRVEVESRR